MGPVSAGPDPLMVQHVIPFDALGMGDVERVGGKNASLGEMHVNLGAAGVRVPGGFATTASAFREFFSRNRLDERIARELEGLDVEDVRALASSGTRIRSWIEAADLGSELAREVAGAYAELTGDDGGCSVAVRSSATAEDLPEASFAGQQETLLNVRGEAGVLSALSRVFASLYNDRAIAYRVHQGFDHAAVALSVGVQRMVDCDRGASGVMFTLDTESGFPEVVLINATWGLGEPLVQGSVDPDEFCVFKPALRAGRPAILRRRLGGKAGRMVFAEKGVRMEETPSGVRRRFCLPDGEVEQLARLALPSRRTTAARWISSGRGTAGTARCTFCRRGRRRWPAVTTRTASSDTASGRGGRCWWKAAASARASAREGRASSSMPARCIGSGAATCSWPRRRTRTGSR